MNEPFTLIGLWRCLSLSLSLWLTLGASGPEEEVLAVLSLRYPPRRSRYKVVAGPYAKIKPQ